MITVTKNKFPFLLFEIREGLYAVSAESVREIVILPNVSLIPNSPPEVRGVINLRGKVLPLVDLRVKLGLPTAKKELDDLIQLLLDRERDHHDWLNELEASVRNKRPFTMEQNPHACKFGRWYEKFQTDNSLLKMTLKKMDEPHKIIHATARDVLQMAEHGEVDGAMQILTARKNEELASLSKLFAEARRQLHEHHRELAVVVNNGEKRFAFTIDRVEAVERISEGDIEEMAGTIANHSRSCDWRVGKRNKTNQTILLFNETAFFNSETVLQS